MNSKLTPDITPNLAISAYHVLQQYCTGQPADCKGCGFYEHCPECFQGIPCDWNLNEEGEINESQKSYINRLWSTAGRYTGASKSFQTP